MAVDKHPSRTPSKPVRPPSAADGNRYANSSAHSHQKYGHQNHIETKPAHKSERAHDFGKVSSPGDQNSADEPG